MGRTYAYYEYKLTENNSIEFVKKYGNLSAKEIKELFKSITGRPEFNHSFSHFKDFWVVSPYYDYKYLFTIDEEVECEQ